MRRWLQNVWRQRRVIGVGVLIGLFMFALSLLEPFLKPLESIELWTLDERFQRRWWKQPKSDIMVVLVDRKETSNVEEVRRTYKKFVEKVSDNKVVGFDMTLKDKTDADEDLIKAMKEVRDNGGNVYLAFGELAGDEKAEDPESEIKNYRAFKDRVRALQMFGWDNIKPPVGEEDIRVKLEENQLYAPPEEFLTTSLYGKTFPRANLKVGSTYFGMEKQKVLRKIPLIMRVKYEEEERGAQKFYPYLGFQIACDLLGITRENIVVVPGRHIVLKKEEKNPKTGKTKIKEVKIPIDKDGYMDINYLGAFEKKFKPVSIHRVIADGRHKSSVLVGVVQGKDKGVQVGDKPDTYSTPYDGEYPGVGVVATVIDNIRSGDFIHRPPWGIHLVIFLFLGLMTGAISVNHEYMGIHSGKGFFGALVLLVLYLFIAFVAFGIGGWWLKAAPPLITLSLMMLVYVVVGYRTIRFDLAEKWQNLGTAGKVATGFFGLVIVSLVITLLLPKGTKDLFLKLLEGLITISAILTAFAALKEKRVF